MKIHMKTGSSQVPSTGVILLYKETGFFSLELALSVRELDEQWTVFLCELADLPILECNTSQRER